MDEKARSTRDINDALLACPMADRLAALVCAVVSDEAHASDAILDLVAVTGMLARQLPAEARLRICWSLLEEVQMIGAKWN
jgi:hypothetical protein